VGKESSVPLELFVAWVNPPRLISWRQSTKAAAPLAQFNYQRNRLARASDPDTIYDQPTAPASRKCPHRPFTFAIRTPRLN